MNQINSVPLQFPLFDPITIKLTKGYETIIDPIDSDLLQCKWCFCNGYAGRYSHRKVLYLHRIILERITGRILETKEKVDHVNGNTFDNRRENLRLADDQMNAANSKKRSDNTSGYRGVIRNSPRYKLPWRSRIQVNGKLITLGHFSTPEEAYAAYCKAAKAYFGDFARLE